MTEPIRQERTILALPQRVRGKHNKNFQTVKVTSNFYSVTVQPTEQIFIFSVKFSPQIPSDNTNLKVKLYFEALSEIKQQISNPVLSGMNIYSTSVPKSIEKEYKVRQHVLKVKQVKVYNLRENQKLLLTFLNNGLKNIMRKLDYVEIGKTGKFFNTKQKEKIDNLLMYSGYKANFVQLEKGILLRVDPAKKIVRNETVLQTIDAFYQIHKDKDKEQRRALLKAELLNKIIMSNYGKSAYYRLVDLEFRQLSTVMLDQKTSLIDYYEQKYKMQIKNLRQPLIVTESRDKEKPCYLVPELMLMTGIPDNFDEMRRKKISQKTIKDPSEKLKEIQNLMDELKNAKEIKAFQEIGLKLNNRPEKIDAKQVPVPKLMLGKENAVEKGKEAFFQLFSKPIFSGKHEIPCTVISSKGADIRPMTQVFEKTSRTLGVQMTITTTNFSGSTQSLENEVTRAIQKGAKICCIVIPMNMKNNYKSIKNFTLKLECVTQVVTQGTLRKKGLQSIATKVLLQIIAKRGNILWVPRISIDLQFSAMLVGFQQTKVGDKTILAMCATINSTYSLVYTNTTTYQGAENKYVAMRKLLTNALQAFSERNKGFPDEIFCFQNSCSGDQINLYNEYFVKQIKKNMKEQFSGASQIAITLIMVNVKTNERFFSDNGKTSNVPAGTLVSQGLVSKNYDFYLISQYSNRGTTVPNHYKVIYCDSKIQEGILQQIIFSQCFNYVNWCGSIKVPGILQYAKKASKFSAEVLGEKSAPESLHSKLYFI